MSCIKHPLEDLMVLLMRLPERLSNIKYTTEAQTLILRGIYNTASIDEEYRTLTEYIRICLAKSRYDLPSIISRFWPMNEKLYCIGIE